jgi:hypothetical protein
MAKQEEEMKEYKKATKLMYFFHNFTSKHLRKLPLIFDNDSHFYPMLIDHLQSKKHRNGTDSVISFYMALSENNKEIMFDWVMNNYKGYKIN